MLDVAAELELDAVEFPTGAWSPAPHVDLATLLDSDAARRELLARVADRDLEISALTCNGNQLDPISGPDHDRVVRDTIALAPQLGVSRVILMSGCPGGPGDRWANWITVAWPPEAVEVLRWQWEEAVIPYWQDLVAHADGARRRAALRGAARPAGRLQRPDAAPPARSGRARSSERTTIRAI